MALLLAATGCTAGWRTPALAPVQVIREQGPTELQVRSTDGSVFYLRDPAVRGDSIVGWTAPAWDQGGALQRRAVAVDDVREVGVRGADSLVNAFLGVLLGWAAFGLFFGAAGGVSE